jgi:hypothetical protein
MKKKIPGKYDEEITAIYKQINKCIWRLLDIITGKENGFKKEYGPCFYTPRTNRYVKDLVKILGILNKNERNAMKYQDCNLAQKLGLVSDIAKLKKQPASLFRGDMAFLNL